MRLDASNRTTGDRRRTVIGTAIAGVVVVHLLALLISPTVEPGTGLVLDGVVSIALLGGVYAVERSWRTAGTIAVPYAAVTGVTLVATDWIALWMVAVAVTGTVVLLLYGLHRYGLVRLGLLGETT